MILGRCLEGGPEVRGSGRNLQDTTGRPIESLAMHILSVTLQEPPYTEPYVRWCERTVGLLPPPTRSEQRMLCEGDVTVFAEDDVVVNRNSEELA
jgi:hypothetical protein